MNYFYKEYNCIKMLLISEWDFFNLILFTTSTTKTPFIGEGTRGRATNNESGNWVFSMFLHKHNQCDVSRCVKGMEWGNQLFRLWRCVMDCCNSSSSVICSPQPKSVAFTCYTVCQVWLCFVFTKDTERLKLLPVKTW